MTRRRARAVAWTMWVVAFCNILAAGVLEFRYPTQTTTTSDPVSNFVWASSWVGFGLVGALIVSNRPRNRLGWVLCHITFGIGLALLTPVYGRVAYLNGLPLGGAATWIASWAFVATMGFVGALLLLFPDGVLASRRRRVIAWVLGVVVALDTVIYAFVPGPVDGDAPPFNPLGVDSLAPVLEKATEIAGTVMAFVMLLVLIDLVARFRRSRGAQRDQFRWFALAALAFPVLFFPTVAVADKPAGFDPIALVFFVCGNGLAVAIGIAVTRHGLYEINRVISRSVSYVLLTALLVGLYLSVVTGLSTVTASRAGDSPLAVASATLLAAAAFGPARRRIQDAVDRRFNRARYDAAATVETYRHRLREEVDLDALTRDLLATVAASMQPAGARLWLRGGR